LRQKCELPRAHGSDTALAAAGRLVAEALAAALGVAVSIDNDSNLAALGEHVWGAGRDCDDSVTVKFHYGIGCGLFVNGTLVRGSGGAGEIGHVAVDERGPLCRCGKRGCLETYASISAIMEALRPQHGELTLAQLMRLLAVRDPRRGARGRRCGRARRQAPGRRLQPAGAATGHRDRPHGAGRGPCP
jgi:predicted NBD/HSP70 family sugar kinase